MTRDSLTPSLRGEDKGFATLSPNSIPQRAYDMADDDTDEYRPHSPSRAHVGPNPAHLGGGPPGVRPGPGPGGHLNLQVAEKKKKSGGKSMMRMISPSLPKQDVE